MSDFETLWNHFNVWIFMPKIGILNLWKLWDFLSDFQTLWFCFKCLNFHAKNATSALFKIEKYISFWSYKMRLFWVIFKHCDFVSKVWFFMPKIGKFHFWKSENIFHLSDFETLWKFQLFEFSCQKWTKCTLKNPKIYFVSKL